MKRVYILKYLVESYPRRVCFLEGIGSVLVYTHLYIILIDEKSVFKWLFSERDRETREILDQNCCNDRWLFLSHQTMNRWLNTNNSLFVIKMQSKYYDHRLVCCSVGWARWKWFLCWLYDHTLKTNE